MGSWCYPLIKATSGQSRKRTVLATVAEPYSPPAEAGRMQWLGVQVASLPSLAPVSPYY